MTIKHFGFEGGPRTNAISALAEYEGIALEQIDVGDVFGDKSLLPKDFMAAFPLGKIPAIEDNGIRLTETIAIAHYLSSKSDKAKLFGSTPQERAFVFQWASFANTTLIDALASWFWPILRGPYNREASEAGKANTSKLYAYLENHLGTDKEYLVGNHITFADLLVSALLQRASEFTVDRALYEPFPNLFKYFNRILSLPEVVKSQGGRQPFLVEKPIEYRPTEDIDSGFQSDL